jgi:hypothetical protein
MGGLNFHLSSDMDGTMLHLRRHAFCIIFLALVLPNKKFYAKEWWGSLLKLKVLGEILIASHHQGHI